MKKMAYGPSGQLGVGKGFFITDLAECLKLDGLVKEADEQFALTEESKDFGNYIV